MAPSEPKHYAASGIGRPTVLDVALLKGIALPVRDISVLHELVSDHHHNAILPDKSYSTPLSPRPEQDNAMFTRRESP